MSRIPYRFDVTADAAELAERHAGLEDGAETDEVVTLAGRLMLRREQGKLTFGTLRQGNGAEIQLFCGAKWTDDFEGFSSRNLGDWLGVSGPVVRTRRGELSIKVADWTLLAEAKRGFGDKWHGINDVEVRSRQRYADLWANPESAAIFRTRSRVLSLTRRWLEDRGFLEVETPMLQQVASGAAARPFLTHHNALDLDVSLRIAPELYLKRLVVGGFEKVFEIGRVFRNEGISNRHNPEFTMLELYEAYADYADIMVLVEELVSYLAEQVCGTTTVTYNGRPLDLSAPWRRATMSDLIEETTGRRVDVRTDRAELAALATEYGVDVDDSWGPGKIMLELYEKTTESNLWDPVFVIDYPTEVSPLSREHRELPDVTERFEAIVAGRELCNAFSELTDPVVQRERFAQQADAKAAGDDEAMALDEDYIRALEYGLPPTGGLGIGMDRLVMFLCDVNTIRDVVLFPMLRPEVD